MRKSHLSGLVVLAWLLLAASSVQAATIGQGVNEAMQHEGDISFIVRFGGRVALQELPAKGRARDEALAQMIYSLRSQAEVSQRNALSLIRQGNATRVVQLWSINALAVTANAQMLRALAALPEVESITLDATLAAPTPQPAATAVAEWNLDAVAVPPLWDEGLNGQGTVIAAVDTGVDVLHPDLAGRWRGGSNSWYDPNGEHATPYDASGHGTQALSI
ncbi:MAG TPA: S8 family serine peptidase, partial [Gammaproteobacteria bacterium]